MPLPDSRGKLADWNGVMLSTRARSAFSNAGVFTVEQARNLTVRQLEAMPFVGRQTIDEIRSAFHPNGRSVLWSSLLSLAASSSTPPDHLSEKDLEDMMEKLNGAD